MVIGKKRRWSWIEVLWMLWEVQKCPVNGPLRVMCSILDYSILETISFACNNESRKQDFRENACFWLLCKIYWTSFLINHRCMWWTNSLKWLFQSDANILLLWSKEALFYLLSTRVLLVQWFICEFDCWRKCSDIGLLNMKQWKHVFWRYSRH